MNRALKRPKVSFPWDDGRGPLAAVFGEEADMFPKFFNPDHFHQQESDLAPGQAIALHLPEDLHSQKTASQCIRACPDNSFLESEEALKLKAIMTWTEIVAQAAHHFQVGKDVLQNYAIDCEHFAIYLAETIEAVMGVKAPSTVLSRGMAVKRYVLWTRLRDEQTWPIDEPTVFQYVKHLRSDGAPASAGSFVRAINFMLGTVEPLLASEVVASQRIQGTARQAALKKRPTKQAACPQGSRGAQTARDHAGSVSLLL